MIGRGSGRDQGTEMREMKRSSSAEVKDLGSVQERETVALMKKRSSFETRSESGYDLVRGATNVTVSPSEKPSGIDLVQNPEGISERTSSSFAAMKAVLVRPQLWAAIVTTN